MKFNRFISCLALMFFATSIARNQGIIIPKGYFEQKAFFFTIPSSTNVSAFNPQFLLNIDFETSLGKNYNPDFYNFLNTSEETEKFNLFKYLFEKNNPAMLAYQQEPRIPRIIHQIWLGGTPPSIFKHRQETIFKQHPGWLYKLWTDDDVKGLKLINRTYFDTARNYAQKADILRYELLYLFGGVYFDWDISTHKSFESLHHMYDFYAGIPGAGNNIWVAIGVLGSVPGHPILKHAIESIPTDARYADICYATGPVHFTKSFVEIAKENQDRVIAFPTNFFYPPLPSGAYKLQPWEIEEYVKQETFAVHYWAASWLRH